MNNSSVDINTCLITTKDNLRKSIDNNDILNQFCNNKDLLREHVIILKDYDEWFLGPRYTIIMVKDINGILRQA